MGIGRSWHARYKDLEAAKKLELQKWRERRAYAKALAQLERENEDPAVPMGTEGPSGDSPHRKSGPRDAELQCVGLTVQGIVAISFYFIRRRTVLDFVEFSIYYTGVIVIASVALVSPRSLPN